MKIAAIEVIRAIAIFCIILIHTGPFLVHEDIESKWYFLGQFIQQISSFAVPFFFIIAGYFFSIGVEKRGLSLQLKKYLARIGSLLVIWIIIDGIFWGDWLHKVLEYGSIKPLVWNFMAIPSFAIERFDLFIFRGTAVSLWFLISLMIGILLLSLQIKLRINKYIIIAVASLGYLFVLSVSFYSQTWIGMGFTIPLEQRGIFIALFFLTVGYFGAENTLLKNRGLILILLSIPFMFIESAILSFGNGRLFTEHQYLFSTPFVAYGIFLISLEHPSLGFNSILYRIGKISLGIYLVHIPVLGAMRFFRETYTNAIWEIIFPIIILILSIFIISILKTIPFIRRIVI